MTREDFNMLLAHRERLQLAYREQWQREFNEEMEKQKKLRVPDVKSKYYNFLEKGERSLLKINNYGYVYILLWAVQLVITVCKIGEVIGVIKLFMIVGIIIGGIHFSSSMVEIINDYIFKKGIKGIFVIIILLNTYKLII